MKITIPEYFSSFFLALASREGAEVFTSGETFNVAMANAFDTFVLEAKKKDLRPNFRVRLDGLHSDSPTIEEGIVAAVRRDLLSMDNPCFEKLRLKYDKAEAQQLIDKIVPDRDLYLTAVDKFLEVYKSRDLTAA